MCIFIYLRMPSTDFYINQTTIIVSCLISNLISCYCKNEWKIVNKIGCFYVSLLKTGQFFNKVKIMKVNTKTIFLHESPQCEDNR